MGKEELMALVKKHSQLDAEEILRAYEMAANAHTGQKREGGEPYITHPAAVAGLLVGIGMDTPTVSAALLHDVVEDTATTLEDVRKSFGDEVAFFVEGVTRLERLPSASTREDDAHLEEAQATLERTGGLSGQNKEQAARYARTMAEVLRKHSEDISTKAETLRKMFLAMAEGHPRCLNQTCRPPAQYANPGRLCSRKTHSHLPGDYGYLCAACLTPRHGRMEGAVGRSCVSASLSERI